MQRVVFPLLVTVAAVGLSAPSAAAQAPKDYTAADVAFMSGMIYHHAQALLIAGWAKSHGASPSVQTLCDRIIASQKDEINLLSRWLADRHEAVPDVGMSTDSTHRMYLGMERGMHGMAMDSSHVMPGMLTQEQLARLDRARGAEFDQLFLQYMIQHHEGAITMVNELFARGAGEENPVYKMASSVFADQTTEIERMQQMLAAQVFLPTPSKQD